MKIPQHTHVVFKWNNRRAKTETSTEAIWPAFNFKTWCVYDREFEKSNL